MSLEQALAENTAALKEMTAALGKGGAAPSGEAAAPAAAKTGKSKAPAPAPAPAIDRSAVNAALEEVKNKFGVDAAKELIQSSTGASKRSEIPDDKLQAAYDAAKKKIDGGEDDDI